MQSHYFNIKFFVVCSFQAFVGSIQSFWTCKVFYCIVLQILKYINQTSCNYKDFGCTMQYMALGMATLE